MHIPSAPAALVLALLVRSISAKFNGAFYKAPLPMLFDPIRISRMESHIVAELVQKDTGVAQIVHEYTDLTQGAQTIVTNDPKFGPLTHNIQASTALLYTFQPYNCTTSHTELELDTIAQKYGYKGLWHGKAIAAIKSPTGKGLVSREMNVFGITALWLNAIQRPQQYDEGQLFFSSLRIAYQPAHKWTVSDEENNQTIDFYAPAQRNLTKAPNMVEMILVRDRNGTTVTTINILAVDTELSDQTKDLVLQPPLGYGCIDDDSSDHVRSGLPSLQGLLFGALLKSNHFVNIELTATKFTLDDELRSQCAPVSETVSVVLARSQHHWDDLQLVSQRSSHLDTRHVLDYHSMVSYDIDNGNSRCTLRRLEQPSATTGNKTGTWEAPRTEHVMVNFNNGLKMHIDSQMMHELFVETEGFHFVKEVSRDGQDNGRLIYFEKTTLKLLFGGRGPTRIMRSYDVSGNGAELSSVIIWLMNPGSTKVEVSYLLSVIEAHEMDNMLEIASLFDVSEECYLSNPDMVQNKDYAFFRFNYPVTAHQSELLAKNTNHVKCVIYEHFITEERISYLRMPRMELEFSLNEGLMLRFLLLDAPPLELLFDSRPDEAIKVHEELGDTNYLAPDLRHCAEICRLHHCQSFSFCVAQRSCVLSNLLLTTAKLQPKAYQESCITLTKPQFMLDPFVSSRSLAETISLFQAQNYEPTSLPAEPGEVATHGSAIDQTAYNHAVTEYLDTLRNYLSESGRNLSTMITVNIEGNFMVLLPSKFELENDPLLEFDSRDEPQTRDLVLKSFRVGIHFSRFKMKSLAGSKNEILHGKKYPKADDLALNWQLFSGLSYDQCAMVCIDDSCSSFSYCANRKECTITDVYELGNLKLMEDPLIESDFDCDIVQRDFLTKFVKFPNVYMPVHSMKVTNATNEAECAHSCFAERSFRCLSFDWCSTASTDGPQPEAALVNGTCRLQKARHIFDPTPVAALSEQAAMANLSDGTMVDNAATAEPLVSVCDHYSRNYLADFHRFDQSEINPAEIEKLKTRLFSGKSVDDCASVCINDERDCSAVQFCIEPEAEGALQSCLLIESVPASLSAGITPSNAIGELIKYGKFIRYNEKCNVFALRADADGANQRHLALSFLDTNEQISVGAYLTNEMPLANALGLYLTIVSISGALTLGALFAWHYPEYIRAKVGRARILMGL